MLLFQNYNVKYVLFLPIIDQRHIKYYHQYNYWSWSLLWKVCTVLVPKNSGKLAERRLQWSPFFSNIRRPTTFRQLFFKMGLSQVISYKFSIFFSELLSFRTIANGCFFFRTKSNCYWYKDLYFVRFLNWLDFLISLMSCILITCLVFLLRLQTLKNETILLRHTKFWVLKLLKTRTIRKHVA